MIPEHPFPPAPGSSGPGWSADPHTPAPAPAPGGPFPEGSQGEGPGIDEGEPPAFRARTVALWLVLIALCALVFGLNALPPNGGGALPEAPAYESPDVRLQLRMLVALRWAEEVAGVSSGAEKADETLRELEEGGANAIDALRIAAVSGYVFGAESALARLDEVDRRLDPATADEPPEDGLIENAPSEEELEALREDARALRAIFESEDADALDAATADRLRARHGWYADAALASRRPPGHADRWRVDSRGLRTVGGMFALVLVILLGMAAGVGLFIAAAVMRARGALRRGMLAAGPALARIERRSPAVLLETFVLFMAGMVLVGLALGVLGELSGLNLSPLLWLLLATAAWPLARGARWGDARLALGWTRGRGVVTEALCGAAGYLAGLPVMALGLLLSLLIARLTGLDPSHPVARESVLSSGWGLALLFTLVVVWAPVVEETFFRGAFYAHLRGRMGALPSALVCGLVFAAVHPQGIAGLPVLTAIGFNLCLIREWRGSLVAPVTAHALNNAMAFGAILLLFA